ncbi:MAG: hypothetical protein KY464_07550 [Gemmatimonadetes bacterium]|nr:hypothetical protein [Gemmatimonadota bacterium]
MDRDSESLLGRILSEPISAQQAEESQEAGVTLEEIVARRAAGAVYSGPERRAQGYLIAEVLAYSPPVNGQEPEFDRPR